MTTVRTTKISLGGKQYAASLLTIDEYVRSAEIVAQIMAVNASTNVKSLGEMVLGASSIVRASMCRADEKLNGAEEVNVTVAPIEVVEALGILMRESMQPSAKAGSAAFN